MIIAPRQVAAGRWADRASLPVRLAKGRAGQFVRRSVGRPATLATAF